MKLEVHIKDKIFTLYCGEGRQKVRWAADAALVRYEHFFGGHCSCPQAVRLEDGTQLDMEATIKEVLEDQTGVWVMFKEDVEAAGLLAKHNNKKTTARGHSFTTTSKNNTKNSIGL